MKLTWKVGGFGAVAIAAAAIFAQVEDMKTINVRGLESDKDNATVKAPADLGNKPETVSISADAIVGNAAESGKPPHSQNVNIANVKPLTLEGMIIPPSSEMAKNLEEAVRDIVRQAGKQIGTVSTNGIENLFGRRYQQLGDGKSYEVEWRKALRLLLSPAGYNFTEDGELVLFGLAAEVDIKHKQLAQERLAANRTPILFTTNDSEGGMELRNAIRDVSVKADVTITTDYMEHGDLYVPAQSIAAEGTLSADDIGKAKEKSAVQQAQVKRTTFDTNGQQIEWRIVLREILNPHDYDFIEVGGVVRIAKRAKLAQWEKEAIAAKPRAAKVIRLYHADPESVVERVKNIKGLLKHPNASLQATRKKDDNAGVVKNLNARLETSSGERMGQSETTSQVFNELVRPRTVPAIVAYDVEENIEAIEHAVRLFDIKEKQVLIEAIIFQLDTDNGETGDIDGIRWDGLADGFSPLYGAISGGGTMFTGANATKGFNVRKGNQVWMRTDGIDFQAWIQLIRSRNNAKVLCSPTLVIGDHSEAAIQVARADPIPDLDSNTLSGNGGLGTTMSVDWKILRTGVLMWVSPEITEKGDSVRLTVHPQVTERDAEKVEFPVSDGRATFSPYNYGFTMNEMDTRATVPSGATLMFGGLVKNKEGVKESKVRWLGDIPLLGWFFRWSEKTIIQQNIVILIRPTILEDTDETGFEKNTLKETESIMKNSGRDLKTTTLEGPYSVKEIEENAKELYEERVVKPFKNEEDEKEDGK